MYIEYVTNMTEFAFLYTFVHKNNVENISLMNVMNHICMLHVIISLCVHFRPNVYIYI